MDISQILTTLRRPKILIEAASYALGGYQRERDLRRITKVAKMPTPRRAFEGLLLQEERLEHARERGDSAYSARRHIDVMAALLAEARLILSPPRRQI